MIVAILADEDQKEELCRKHTLEDVQIIWADSMRSLKMIEADVYFDLLFENDAERSDQLRSIPPEKLFINSVIDTSDDTGLSAWRINAWPGMLNRTIVEIAAGSAFMQKFKKDQNAAAEHIFQRLGWRYQLVPDIAGMVTPRIIAMIINEAWYALGEGISTKDEIDIAMKLGTNYPYGPFEWGELIGYDRVRSLLIRLSMTDARYTIAPKLMSA